MRSLPPLAASASGALLVLSCGSVPPLICTGEDCTTEPDPDAQTIECAIDADAPSSLLETCYSVIAGGELAPNLRYYEPRFEAFAGDVMTRRWAYVPADSQIDVTSSDRWEFPVGSILWQEFDTDDGETRIETRMLEKTGLGANGWRATTYFWTTRQTDADRADDGRPAGADGLYAIDALADYRTATPQECVTCHQGSADMVLGFGALQLSEITRAGNVAVWSEAGFFTEPQSAVEMVGEADDQAVLGYLHVNCGSCHSPLGSERAGGMDLSYSVENTTDLASTNVFRTAVYRNLRIVPTQVGMSTIYQRLRAGADGVINQEFATELAVWIAKLQLQTAIVQDTLPITLSADTPEGVELLGYPVVVDDADRGTVFSIKGAANFISRLSIPVDTSKTYRVSGMFRSNGTVPSRLYYGFTPYDGDGVFIAPDRSNRRGAAVRVDSAAVSARVIATLDPVLDWGQAPLAGHQRAIGFYYDGDTSRLPDFVLRGPSPSSLDASAGAYRQATETTITLNEPLPEDVLSQLTDSTVVMNHFSGGTHLYAAAASAMVPSVWTEFAGTVTGEGFTAGSLVFRPQTDHVRLLFLGNYQQAGEDVEVLFDDLKVEIVP